MHAHMNVPKEAKVGIGCPGAGVPGSWDLLIVVLRTQPRSPVRAECSELLSRLPSQSQNTFSSISIINTNSQVTHYTSQSNACVCAHM